MWVRIEKQIVHVISINNIHIKNHNNLCFSVQFGPQYPVGNQVLLKRHGPPNWVTLSSWGWSLIVEIFLIFRSNSSINKQNRSNKSCIQETNQGKTLGEKKQLYFGFLLNLLDPAPLVSLDMFKELFFPTSFLAGKSSSKSLDDDQAPPLFFWKMFKLRILIPPPSLSIKISELKLNEVLPKVPWKLLI